MAGSAPIQEVWTQAADVEIHVKPTEIPQGHPVDIGDKFKHCRFFLLILGKTGKFACKMY